jgi:hypothetical protein
LDELASVDFLSLPELFAELQRRKALQELTAVTDSEFLLAHALPAD